MVIRNLKSGLALVQSCKADDNPLVPQKFSGETMDDINVSKLARCSNSLDDEYSTRNTAMFGPPGGPIWSRVTYEQINYSRGMRVQLECGELLIGGFIRRNAKVLECVGFLDDGTVVVHKVTELKTFGTLGTSQEDLSVEQIQILSSFWVAKKSAFAWPKTTVLSLPRKGNRDKVVSGYGSGTTKITRAPQEKAGKGRIGRGKRGGKTEGDDSESEPESKKGNLSKPRKGGKRKSPQFEYLSSEDELPQVKLPAPKPLSKKRQNEPKLPDEESGKSGNNGVEGLTASEVKSLLAEEREAILKKVQVEMIRETFSFH